MTTTSRTLNRVDTNLASSPGPVSAQTPRQGFSALLKQIIGTSPIGVVTVDLAGVIRSANQTYCDTFGYRADELIGKPFTLVYPERERADLMARHQAFLRGEVGYCGAFQIHSGSGERRSVKVESVAVQDSDGLPMRLVYIADELADGEGPRNLTASSALSQSLLDGLTSRVCVIDRQGKILSVNKAWREQAHLIGTPDHALQEGEDYLAACAPSGAGIESMDLNPTEFLCGIRKVLSGELDSFECRYPCRDVAQPRWFMARISRMPIQGPERFIVAHDDITSVAQLQHELLKREAFLADLTQSIPEAVFRVEASADEPMRIVHLSQGSEPILDLNAAQLCNQPALLLGLLDDRDMPRMIRGLAQLQHKLEPWSQEFRIRTPEGALKWIAGHATARREADGRVIWTGTLRDITARKAAETRVCESEVRYRTLFETVPQGIVYQDPDGRITSANPAAQRILGLTLAQLQGRESMDQRWRSIRPDGSDLPGEEHPSMVALRTGKPVRDTLMGVQTGSGRGAWLRVNATPVFADGHLVEVYSSFEDVTEQQELNAELRNLATTDALTGLANRRTAMERGTIEYERIRRKPTLHCTVLALDIDHFKRINDQHGHAAGDEVLRQVANRLRRELRTTDVIARIGGEEFMVLLPDTLPEHALMLAERMRGHISATPISAGGKSINVALSIGVSPIDPTDARLEDSFERADFALYQAKHGGRNTVRFAAGPSTEQPYSEMAQIAQNTRHTEHCGSQPSTGSGTGVTPQRRHAVRPVALASHGKTPAKTRARGIKAVA